MTMIQNSAIQNINLTCGGNCILRKGTNESEISSGETVSMHSGTDSQYERANPDVSPEKIKETVIPSEDLIIDISNSSFEDNYSPEQASERYANFLPNRYITIQKNTQRDTLNRNIITQGNAQKITQKDAQMIT